MMSWQQIRERIDAAEPVGGDIDEAVAAYRRLRDPTLSDEARANWTKIFENSAIIAEAHAWWYGPQLVRSAVENQARERAAASRSFADGMSLQWMQHAGFSKTEIEDGERAFVKAIIDREMQAYFKTMRLEIYETLGLPAPPEDEN